MFKNFSHIGILMCLLALSHQAVAAHTWGTDGFAVQASLSSRLCDVSLSPNAIDLDGSGINVLVGDTSRQIINQQPFTITFDHCGLIPSISIPEIMVIGNTSTTNQEDEAKPFLFINPDSDVRGFGVTISTSQNATFIDYDPTTTPVTDGVLSATNNYIWPGCIDFDKCIIHDKTKLTLWAGISCGGFGKACQKESLAPGKLKTTISIDFVYK